MYAIQRCARSGPKKLTKTYHKGFLNHSTDIAVTYNEVVVVVSCCWVHYRVEMLGLRSGRPQLFKRWIALSDVG